MKRQFLISLFVLFFVSGFAGAVDLQRLGFADQLPSDSANYKQDELIVRFADPDIGSQLPEGPMLAGPLTRRAIRSKISDFIVAGAAVEKEYDNVSPGTAVVKLPEGTNVLEAGIRFLQSANVLYAEPNFKYRLLAVPNDPFFTDLWGLDNTGQTGGTVDADIDAPEAWDITTGSSDIVVAVIDSGIDHTHPDLAANMWVNIQEQNGTPGVDDDNNGYIDDIYGYDFAGASAARSNDGKSDPKDVWFHGTHVAGIIGAVGNNGQGVTGVCWNVKLMALKIFADDFNTVPAAFASDAMLAVQYAIDNGVDIINASWGGEYDSQPLKEAIEKAGDAGLLFVAAAGNDYGSDNDETPVYPASYDLDNIISVMSTDPNDMMSDFSNFGVTSVDVAAPGTVIVSTTPTTGNMSMTFFGVSTNYSMIPTRDMSGGTSASTGYVSGASALVWSHYPALPKEVIKGLLIKTVDPVLTTPKRCLSGGRLNIYNALTLIPPGKPGRVINTRDPNHLYTTIQASIDEAVDGDELIAEAGTLFFEGVDFDGKAITLRSGDINEPANTTISPENTVILGMLSDGSTVTFANNEGPDTVLRGFTISRGDTNYGGGITCNGASPTITDCIISNNIAEYYGAGIDCTNGSSPIIKNCTITGNQTSGSAAIGGGINIEDSSPTIENCVISYNFADNVGGGIACYNSNPLIFNCLIANNAAVYEGGGIDLENSSPIITNCTIVVDDPNAPKDGGIFASEDSSPVITNCILWGNGDDLFNCTATYSCIEDDDQGIGNIHIMPTFITGPLGDYYLSQTAAGQLTDSSCIDLGNPDTDPGLQLNTYTTRTDGEIDAGIADMGFHYLAIPAKMLQLNITVAGNGTVEPGSGTYRQYEVVQLKADPNEGYRIKSWMGTEDDSSLEPEKTITMIADTNISIEFELIPLHLLTTKVIGGHGEIDPSLGRGAYYPEGTVVILIAYPERTYGIDKWTGTDDDASWATKNTVTMDSDKEVQVYFRQPKSLHVPGQYPTIRSAIDAAYDHGDKVIVSADTYPGGYDFQGKAITVSSEHPDDPATVAATIIDCTGRSNAFTFQSGEGRDSVLDGFTIINGSKVTNPDTPPNTGGTGGNGANAFGGAITCLNGASPTLSNLVIRSCSAWGQNGEDASFIHPAPQPPPPAPDPLDPNAPFPVYPVIDPNDPFSYDPNNVASWDPNDPWDPSMPWDPSNPQTPASDTAIDGMDGQDGANGLDGEAGADGADGADGYKGGDGGLGYGGAMYFDANCAPIILNCTITDCNAVGGNGGYGGRGQDGQDGQDGQGGQQGQDGQAGQEGYNDGATGAGGNGGNGGAGGPGGKGGNGGRGGDGGAGAEALGGAMYFGPDCRPTIRYCTILNCMTNQGIGSRGGIGGSGGAGGAEGGTGNAGGAGGDGDPAGEDGAANEETAPGGDGGTGGDGGNASPDGARTWAGAIYFGENCDVDISDTIIANNATTTIPRLDPFDPNEGGDPNAFEPGTGGAAGTDGAEGAAGAAGSSSDPSSVTTFGGGNYYEAGVKIKMTNCKISYNASEQHDGGGEYYSERSTATFNSSDFIGNRARYGAGQFYNPRCTIEVKDCLYDRNAATRNGGGLIIESECLLDIDDSRFSNNLVLGYGGGVYGGGEFIDPNVDDDIDELVWHNNSTIKVEDTEFYSNLAGFGGGMYWHGEDSEVTVSYCKFDDNTADHGGGLYFSKGAPKIIGCTITNNDADDTLTVDPAIILDYPVDHPGFDPVISNIYGDFFITYDPNAISLFPIVGNIFGDVLFGGGGGIFCWSSEARIEDCIISNNSSSGSGGGVYLGGDPSAPLLKNCLIERNSASIDGGGIVANWFVEPTILNCTIVNNQAYDDNDPEHGIGGGLSCTYESKTALINSILWNNKSVIGNQIAIGSDTEPIYLDRPAELTVSYSDIQGGQAAEAIHVEPGRILNWLAGNINADPLFVQQNYLSQTQAGQAADSPCVDAGSDLASNLNMFLHTTRTDRVADTGIVDMGYHQVIHGPEEELTLVVVGPGAVEADIDPSDTEIDEENQTYTFTYETHRGEVVTFTAVPNEGYRVKSWSGTDKDPSWNTNINMVTVNGSEMIRVEFEQDIYRNLLVPAQYSTIDEAIEAADQHGTNIIVNRGVHAVGDPNGLDFQGKNITLMSADPIDPNVVAATIIDCRGRAFWFHSGEDHNTKVLGFTIRNGYVVGAVGIAGGIPGYYLDPNDDTSPFVQASGTDATGTAYGGAILCENASSPTIENCIITDCTVVGAIGGAGISGAFRDEDSSDNGEWGGDGGNAEGYAYGGAIACLGRSNPIISNCTIMNNTAIGAIGGDGGNGSLNLGSGLASHGGDGGNTIGEGLGGGIYCENKSTPVVTNCIFTNNAASSGAPGSAGFLGEGEPLEDEDPPYPMAADGFAGFTIGVGYGGAAYFRSADPTFVDCTFSDNQASQIQENLVSSQVVFEVGIVRTYVTVDIYTSGGALYSDSGNTVVLKNCRFARNLGGAVYCAPNCDLDVEDCSFSGNSDSLDGGAIFAGRGSYVDITDSTFVGNSTNGDGGALNCKTDAKIKNCLFRENEAAGNGGAVDAYYYTGNPEVRVILGLNFESCSFAGNKATGGFDGWGGAVHFKDFDAKFTDCSFVDNVARGGGGLFLIGGTITLTGGVISSNRSIGGDNLDIGGAIACVDTNATIENCIIKDNVARGVNGAGGAINFYSGPVKHLVRNCLITGNSATVNGGAISCNFYAKPEITNCTFGDNWARSLGGAIFCDWSSDATIIDSIFQNCDNHAIAEEHFGEAIIKHCLFNDNPGGDYGRYDTVTQLIDTISGSDFDNTNIEGDPLYADGTLGGFYLSQVAAGQAVNSPAVDAGSGDASDFGLSDYTTRTDGIEDDGIVDIGYHERIPSTIPEFKLDATVVGGHGTVNPNSATAYKGRIDNIVTLVAHPEAGYKVKKWTGTDDDFPYGLTKTITLLSNKTVTVEFEQAKTFHIPDQYHSISAALNATDAYGNPVVTDGDKIIVSQGTYREYNLDFAGRSITIASERPDDPNCVAGTVIDCAILTPFDYPVTVTTVVYPVIIGGGRAFIFRGGEGPDAVIDGFTIINGDAVGYSESHASPDQGYPAGGDGEDAFGGAIASFGPSSPTISNCVIKNCMARGRYAGDGLDRTPDGIDDGPGGAGGEGGIGYGGAMYFAAGSKPTIVSCKIINCQATGGKGGRGYHGKGSDMPGGDAGNGGEAYGGAMYFETGCKPTINNCIIEGCSTTPGEGNEGGNATGNALGGWGGVNGAEAWAGAIFCSENCDITIMDTKISHSLVNTEIQRDWSGGLNGNGTYAPSGFSITSTYGGANYYAYGCRVKLIRSTIDRSRVASDSRFNTDGHGGAEYYLSNCDTKITDCAFFKNVAGDNSYADGGGLAFESNCSVDIINSNLAGNLVDGEYSSGGAIYSETSWRIRIKDSYIMNSKAAFGGGLYWYGVGSEVMISGSIISGNTADHGGGLYWSNGAPRITGCDIRDNTSNGRFVFRSNNRLYGGGGGIFSWLSNPTIEHSSISGNVTYGSGGGVYFGGGAGSPVIHNCLITENKALLEGGGINSYWSVKPTISNCTIADNIAHNPKNKAHGRGGGLSCSYESETILIDSILWGNKADHGNQIAIGSDNNPDLIQRPAELWVSYCDIEGGIDAVSNEFGRTIHWSNLLEVDPLFVTGPFSDYYLSQVPPMGDQAIDSPAVNAGSDLASILGLDTYTTGTEGIADTDKVDMGYHYNSHSTVPKYKLTLGVVGGRGKVELSEPEPLAYDPAEGTYTFYAGTKVTITATPDAGWRITSWSGGTAFDGSNYNITVVTMNSDKDVLVTFGRIRVLDVPGDYTNIWSAIRDANNGDVIVIAPGVYSYEPGQHPDGDIITIDRKAITITGTNPQDPCSVAATIIDGRMVISNVGRDTIINGLTFTNSELVDWFSPAPAPGPGNDGIPGSGFEGGGMELVEDASPTVLNCRFDSCYVWGSDGSNGNDGVDSRGSPGNGGWAGWAYGGAVVVGNAGKPLFNNCTFVDCWARGGDGGNTGTAGWGGNWETELVDGRNWTWDYGPFMSYWKYSGYGGAVYCHPYSAPEFEECRFENNRAVGGSCGCNTTGTYTVHSPLSHYKIPSFGGAIYAAEYSSPSFTDCFFTGNEADVNGLDVHHLGDSVPINYDPYISYGGAVAYEDGASLTFENCEFVDNMATTGGAIWCNWSDTTISDSNFVDNTGYHGGGVYIVGGSTEIGRVEFSQNEALIDVNIPSLNIILDPNDPNALVRVLGEGGAIHFLDTNAKIYDCNITRNEAFAGGGVYLYNSIMTMADCNVADSNAYHGGGLYAVDSEGTITESTITRNHAVILPMATPIYPTTDPNNPSIPLFDPNISLFGQGGGYYCRSSAIDITNSILADNESNGSGGAIYYSGIDFKKPFTPLLYNSLLTGNTAGSDGGGVSANWYAAPTISNCTIADNKVTGTTGIGPGYGGGLYCSNSSNVEVINSIIWGNISADGAQVAIATGTDKESMPSTVSITYSDIGPQSDPNQSDPIVAVAASGVGSQKSVSGPQTTGSGKLIEGSSIYRKFDAGQNKVKVIVVLAEPDVRKTTNWDDPQSVSQLRVNLASRQASVLSTLTSDEFTTRRTYQNVAAFSGEVSREGLNKLLTHSLVRFIEPIRYDRVMLAQAIPQANALEIRHAYSGKGIAVAIVDTGVDYSHPMLGGTETFPNAKVIGGYDFADGDYDPMPRGTAAGINPVMAHGTSCAGIAAGNLGMVGNYIGGVAYDARIYALKIAPDSNDYPGLPRDASIAAWDWCITHRNDDPKHPIKVISNSWGGSPWTDDPAVGDAASPAMTTLADTAAGLGITILASSGNEYSAGQGLGWPSCMSNVISVGATYDAADMVLPYSNTDENLDILAPADPVYTTDIVGAAGFDLGDYTPNFNGTSSSCPFAAGCVASIQNAAMEKIGRYLTPAEVRELLISTGDPITDTKVAITKPRVNLAAAIRSPSGPPIYIEEDCIINEWQAPVTNSYAVWDTAAWNGNVIQEDPNFIAGYYLSQFAAGQVTESNCVDGGSDLASVIGLDTRTTRVDGINDANVVDMGYHYDRGASRYQLTVTVRENPNDPGIHGLVKITVDPNSGSYYAGVDPNGGMYYEGTELILTAMPDEGYYLQGWYDANGVLVSVATELDIVMDANQVFEVRFRLPRKVEVSGEDISLSQAVNSAQNGDTLVVAAGTYDGDIDFRGKEIKLVSTNPDDPNIIADTIIDCGNATRAFTFNNGEGPGSMINGFTIINGTLFADHGGAIYIGPDSSPTIVNVTIRDCQVTYGSGGAIYVDANSAPTFKYVTINNCSTVGISILTDPNDPNSVVNIGGGNGGGVYLSTNSRPVFTNCTISDCSTDGSGGAVYCGNYSSALFTDCNFENNHASLSGGGIYHASNSSSIFNLCTFNNNEAEYSGGGIYYNINCDSEVADCNFTGNDALGAITTSILTDPNDPNTLVTATDNSPVGMGGGIYCNSDSYITVAGSIFEGNSAEEGGGFYLDVNSVGEISDCNVTENTSARGGGLFCVDCPDSTIINCAINYNEAVNVVTTTQYFLPDPNDANAPPVPIQPGDPAFDPTDPNLIVITSQDRSGIGQGGGIYSFAGPTLIADCQINYNNTSTSGGGIYFAGSEYKPIMLRNCLITNNLAGRDGGGISNNWQNVLEIANCTIADNALTGIYSFGGGFYGSYNSNTVITNSIIWNNAAGRGSQIAIASDDPADPLPSVLKIHNSNIDLRVGETVTLVDPNFVPVIRPGFNEFSLPANDDLSTGTVDIGFTINYFGTMTSTLYVNNNGNVTFDSPLWTFTPFALTTNIGTPIIAPFFADVDTRTGTIVTYGPGMVDGRAAFGVNWVDVGYFATHVDKLNSFQLILIDRSDRAPGDFDIEFNYANIDWETGDASMGQDGFGGFSARAGFSHGSGNPGTYFEVEGSGVNGAFLDSNLNTGLIHGSRNSSVLGRYIFTVTRGALDIGLYDVPIYVEESCVVEGWDPNDPTYPLDPNAPSAPWDPNTNNIAADPNFAAGYYLSQIASGQNVDSPCVDAGSGDVNDPDISLGDYTTRTDGVNDVNIVDLGYHYRAGLLGYHLTVTVVEDPNDPNDPFHGYVEPNDVTIYLGFDNNIITLVAHPDEGYKVKRWTGTDNDRSTNWRNTVTLTGDRNVTIEFEPAERYTLTARVIDRGEGPHGTIAPRSGTYYDGETITLTATPEPGYRVKVWTGTDDDSSTNPINTVTINGANAVVTVEFWQPVPAVISVPGDYQRIQDAVTAAQDGDTIVVDTGVYYGQDQSLSLVIDKNIYITSRDPHDPCTVEATIIRGNFTISPWQNIGVILAADATLNGFTIEDFGGNVDDGDDGDRDDGIPNGVDGGSLDGAGIWVLSMTSPVIKNCIIRNNVINAGDGGRGVDADDDNNAGRGGWGGYAHGAGIYCGAYSTPQLINCRIENNIARGGSGGNGGDYDDQGGYANYGGNFSREGSTIFPIIDYPTDPNVITYDTIMQGHLWEIWGYTGDYRWYSAYGGGVYCDIGSNVTFESCEIRGNRTYGGMSGQGGIASAAGRPIEPLVPYEIPSYGGGVYCAADSTIIFTGCTFEDNIASETEDPANPNHSLSPYVGYGGGVCAENSALVSFTDCNFVDNQADTGGGIYVGDTLISIIDCNIASNEALRGGGFFGIRGGIDMKHSIILNNQAVQDVNDPNDDDVLSIGAGLCFWSVNANIFDCTIRGNLAQASGGGAYLRGDNESVLRNCLIINNAAGRDGGGISVNWYARPTIANCTFSGNAASGTEGEHGNTGLGGALYCGYDSDVSIIDSILWNDFGLKGQEIAVGGGFVLDPKCGAVTVKYSDVKSSLNHVWIDPNCVLNLKSSDGNIDDDPLFVSGYYLSQTAADQSRTSPCVNKGSDYASHVGLLGYTTRTDHGRDTGIVDMGYHYNTDDKCRFADFVFDGVIDLRDHDRFAQILGFVDFEVAMEKWLEEPLDMSSSESNDWRDGTDITTDRHVNEDDLEFLLIACEGAADINAPTPNPSEWSLNPYISSESSISMRAKSAFDAWSRDVEYFFDCITPGGHDSGWQDSREYTDTGITIGNGYGYRVRARDRFGNVTEWSELGYSGIDTEPPAPPPYIITIDANSPTSITMVATVAYDYSGVEYFFENTRGNGHDSGWQSEPNYTDVNLAPDTEYGYRVKARDTSSGFNDTAWSATVYIRTPVPPDTDPPTPDPMEWDLTVDPNGFDGTPREIYGGGGTFDYYAIMTAVIAVDAGGGPVEYYFACDEGGFDSGWVPNPTYQILLGRSGQGFLFRVRARDQFGNMTGWSQWDRAD